MQIDMRLTKQAILSTGRTLAGWGRLHGLPRGSLSAILNGKFVAKKPDSGVYGRVIAALEADGFLVRLPDDGQEQERAA